MAFEQAAIKVEKEKEFEQLKAAINRALSLGSVQKYLKRVSKAGIRIRDFDSVLAKGILEQLDQQQCPRAASWYSMLTISDQAQIKEYYLFKVEEIAPELRSKFHKLYQYY
jgi:hypothetical protein